MEQVTVPLWQLAAIICIALFFAGVGINYWLKDLMTKAHLKALQLDREEQEQKRRDKDRYGVRN